MESIAEEVLSGKGVLVLASLVENVTKGKESTEEVKTSVQHIMINLIVHGIDLVDVIKNLQTRGFTNRQETGGDGQEALSEHHCYWQWY